MFNVSKIRTGLYGVVGLRQPLNPDLPVIDSANLVSRSGYFATDNPYVKIDFINSNVDYSEGSDAEFNTILKNIQEDSITAVTGLVFNRSDYIDRQVLFPYAHNRVNTNVIPSGFIGHKIEVSIEKNVAFKITRTFLDFSGTGSIELLLFNTSQSAPLFSKNVSITTAHQVEVLDWNVDNSGDTYKGEYYFGYVSNGSMTLDPFKRDYERSDIESNVANLDLDTVVFKNHATATLPDLTTEESTDLTTGLNPDITVYYDYTDLILQNEMLFSSAINYQFQITILSQYLASLRSNREERKSGNLTLRLIQEIEGQRGDGLVTITGIRPLLNKSISNIKKEIELLREGYFGEKIMVFTMT